MTALAVIAWTLAVWLTAKLYYGYRMHEMQVAFLTMIGEISRAYEEVVKDE